MPGKSEHTIEHARRDAEAAELRARGKTYDQIATALGMHDRSHARKAVQRAMVATVQEAGDELRALEIERLNRLLDFAWQRMEKSYVAHSNGRVVMLDGAPVEDVGPQLSAMDRILRIMERRAKLLGLDAPQRHEVLTIDAIDAEIARLEREHAEHAGRSAAGAAAAAPGAANGHGKQPAGPEEARRVDRPSEN